MAVQLKHPSIGEIHGVQGDEVVQFLGVKYATVADRFAASKVIGYEPNNSITDATKLGPYVLSPIQGLDAEYGFIQHALPKPELKMSETDGLNLNITVPTDNNKDSSINPNSKLPVLVFVHGGGFGVGSNTWPQYDQARIVKLSKEIGMPIIGVGIGYRLGASGFLTSEELHQAGYLSNNGLRDQANALHWVRKYISGFGGDPENVTFGGESAGSVAGTLHLHSQEPLFKRLFSMSGTSLMLPPLPSPVSELTYSSVLQALGLEKLSASERVKALLEVPAEDFLTKIGPGVSLLPVIDGDVIPGAISFSQISSKDDIPSAPMPGRKWCTDLLIGDCQFDASILAFMLPTTENIGPRFTTSLLKTLSAHPKTAQTILQSYNIAPSLPDHEALKNILRFVNDISFYAPTISFAQGWPAPGKAHVYHFNQPNPWEGPWKGEATHILDVAFLFLNYLEHLGAEEKEVATSFAKDVVSFVNGKSAWGVFGGEEGSENVRVYGKGKEGSGSGRSGLVFELGREVGLDLLNAVWGNFLLGK